MLEINLDFSKKGRKSIWTEYVLISNFLEEI